MCGSKGGISLLSITGGPRVTFWSFCPIAFWIITGEIKVPPFIWLPNSIFNKDPKSLSNATFRQMCKIRSALASVWSLKYSNKGSADRQPAFKKYFISYLSDVTVRFISVQLGNFHNVHPLNSISSGNGLRFGCQSIDQSAGRVLFNIIAKCGHTAD